MTHETVSRRNFIGGIAATAAGAAVLAACDDDGNTQPTDDTFWLPETWNAESDVVIIGFGAAGASAAYFAARAGATVNILDLTTTGGGDTAISGGYVFFGGGTALQQQAGVSETPDQMFAAIRAMGGTAADETIQRVWCQRNKELYDFLVNVCGESWAPADMLFTGSEEAGLFRSLAPGGAPIPHGVVDPDAGPGLFAKLSAAALSVAGVTLTGRVRAIRFVQDPRTNRVLGVVAKAVDDKGVIVAGAPEQFFKARKGVIIATGVFSADRSMMGRFDGDLMRLTHIAARTSDGSGIHLGQRIGGDVRQLGQYWAYCGKVTGTPGFAKSVLVNKAGARFVPEDTSPYYVGYHIVRHEPLSFAIFDGSVAKPVGAIEAATIPALVEAINTSEGINMSPAALQATIEFYNAQALSSGGDAVFKKDPQHMTPLTQAPFYALKVTAADCFGTTTGGLRTNEKAQLLYATGEPIPSVYSAGICVAVLPGVYTGSGSAISNALTFGKIAAENVVTETVW